MKFIGLGYYDESKFNALTKDEQTKLMDACFAYDAELRRGGHIAGGEALQPAGTAVTLRFRDGKVAMTDGPYAETKEQLGGILILEARDLNHAIQLMEKHPGVKIGPFEIRATDEMCKQMAEAKMRSELGAAAAP